MEHRPEIAQLIKAQLLVTTSTTNQQPETSLEAKTQLLEGVIGSCCDIEAPLNN